MAEDDIESIKGVQEAESEAARTKEKAVSTKAAKITSAQESAGRILSEAEEKAKRLREESLTSIEKEIENDTRNRLVKARASAAKVRQVTLGDAKLKKMIKDILKEISGA